MTITDWLSKFPGCENASAVDVSSTDATLSPPCRMLWIGVTGDVKVDMAGGQTAVTFKSVPVGPLYVRAIKVYHTGTTGNSIVSMW